MSELELRPPAQPQLCRKYFQFLLELVLQHPSPAQPQLCSFFVEVVTPFSQLYSMKNIRENHIDLRNLRSIPSYFVGVYLPTARREAGAPTPELRSPRCIP